MSREDFSPRDWRHWATMLGAAGLGAVFLVAGLTKMQDVAGFFHDIEGYRIFSPAVAAGLAYFVPALESVAGAAVLLARWRRAGACVLGFLLAAFLVLLAVSWARGLDVTCGCFGPGTAGANYPLRLGRDAVLLALAVFIFKGSAVKSPRP